ncbi:fibronectin type III domain-containing protein [Fodinicola feengrottensis]
MTRLWAVALVLVVAVTAGCADTATTAPKVSLTATLVPPVDIKLAWRDRGPTPAGRIVEFANAAAGPYTILGFLPPGQMSYDHRDLIPQTAFYYRVVPYYGPTTAAITRTLPPGDYDDKTQAQDHIWAEPRTVRQPAVAPRSVQGGGAPTDLKATVMNANGIKLTWTDRASDESGYLVEVKPAGSADFRVVQVLEENINSCGVVILPNEKTATYRVRAFVYGPSSNTASQITLA